MRLLIIYLCALSFSATAQKKANCSDYDDNRVRCLAKKRCLWNQALIPTKGFCTFKPTADNEEEMAQYKVEQDNKLKCLQESSNLKSLAESLAKATIYQDTAAIENLNEKIKYKKEDLLKISNCRYEDLIDIDEKKESTNPAMAIPKSKPAQIEADEDESAQDSESDESDDE